MVSGSAALEALLKDEKPYRMSLLVRNSGVLQSTFYFVPTIAIGALNLFNPFY